MTAPPFNTKYCGRMVVGMIGREGGGGGQRKSECVCVSCLRRRREEGERKTNDVKNMV